MKFSNNSLPQIALANQTKKWRGGLLNLQITDTLQYNHIFKEGFNVIMLHHWWNCDRVHKFSS